MQIIKRIINGKVSKNYYLRVERRGREYFQSLRTGVLADAEREAKKKLKLIEREAWGELDQTKVKSDYATIGEVLEVYMAAPIRMRARRSARSKLLNFVRAVWPGRDEMQVRTSELNKEVVRKFELEKLKQIGREVQRGSEVRVQTEESVRQTIVSTLIGGRSVFSRKHGKHYEAAGLKFPDLTSFLKEPVESPERRNPRAPDAVAIARMLAAVPKLKEEDPAVYCAWLLMARLGLRPIEAISSREFWVRAMDDYFMFDVIKQPEDAGVPALRAELVRLEEMAKQAPNENQREKLRGEREVVRRAIKAGAAFRPKKNEGSVPMAADVWAELETFKALRTDGFLIPGETWSARRAVVERGLSKWVKQFLRGTTTTTYELRRWAGSLVLEAHNGDITAARDFLRHEDINTTMEWYAYRLNKVKPLGMAGLATPAAAVAA